MINDFDEADTIVFEDFKILFVKDEDIDEIDDEPPEDQYVIDRYENIHSVYDQMKEHFIYTGVKYFDKVDMSDFNDYFIDANHEVGHGLEISQEIPDFVEIPDGKIKKPNIFEWIGMNITKLKMSYQYISRLAGNHGLHNGSFIAFCQLGYESSTI